jgi:tetratricopeptide (TPR) repeat protein
LVTLRPLFRLDSSKIMRKLFKTSLFLRGQASLEKTKGFIASKSFDKFEAEVEEMYFKLFAGELPVFTKQDFDELFVQFKTALAAKHKFSNFGPYRCYWGASVYLRQKEDFESSLAILDEGLKHCENNIQTSLLTISKGVVYQMLNRHKEAQMEYIKGINLSEGRANDENAANLCYAYLELAKYEIQYKPTEAIAHLEQCLYISERHFGYRGTQIVECGVLLAELYFQTKKIDSGIILLEKIFVAMELQGTPILEVTQVALSLANAYQTKKAFQLEIHVLGRISSMLTRFPRESISELEYDWCRYRVDSVHAIARYLKGDVQKALSMFTRLLQSELGIVGQWYDVNKAEVQRVLSMRHFYLALVYLDTKSYEDAKREFDGAKIQFTNTKNTEYLKMTNEYLDFMANPPTPKAETETERSKTKSE